MNKLKIITLCTAVLFSAFCLSCEDRFNHDENTPDISHKDSVTQNQSESSQDHEESKNPLDIAKESAYSMVEGLVVKDFGGRKVNITVTQPEFFVPDMDGGMVDTSLYYRNKLVEDKYNIELDFTVIDNIERLYRDIEKSNLAGEYYTDFLSVPMRDFSKFIAGNNLLNLNSLPFLNTDSIYMKNSLADVMDLNGSLYCLFGSAFGQAEFTYAMFFNKDLLKDDVDDPYELYQKGEWTWDSLISFPLKVKNEHESILSGKEVLEPGYVRSGCFSDFEEYFHSVFESGDISYISRDDDGLLELDYNTRSADVLTDLFSKIMVYNNGYYDLNNVEYETELSAFADGKLAFMPAKLLAVKELAGKGVNFGVTVMPKFYTAQESHRGWIDYLAPGIGVPAYCEDTELAGCVLNCLYAASFAHMDKAQELEYISLYLPDNRSAVDMEKMISYGKTDISYMLGKSFNKVKDATYGVWASSIYDEKKFDNQYSSAKEKYTDYLKGIR